MLSFNRLVAGLGLFFAIRIGYFIGFGILADEGPAAMATAVMAEIQVFALLLVAVVVAFRRPTGTDTLASVVRGALSDRGIDRSSIRIDLLVLEAVGTVFLALGFGGLVFFAELVGRYYHTFSLAEAVGVTSIYGVAGNGSLALLVVGILCWMAAWIGEGVRIGDDGAGSRTGR